MRSVTVHLVFLLIVFGGRARSANLSAPAQTANPGQTLAVPLAFTSAGSSISGVQFDLSWSPPLHLNVAVGDQLRTSTKLLFTNLVSPGSLRCLVIGMNQDVIPDGELLQLLIGVDSTAAAGTATVGISNVVATTPVQQTAASANPVSIQIQSGVSTTLAPESIVNAASLVSGPVSPGEIISIFAPLTAVTTPVVLLNGQPAPVLYAGSSQINAIVPFGLSVSQSALVELRSGNATVATATLPSASASPGLFAQSGDGLGAGAILNPDYSINSPLNPAPSGSIVMLYGTGFGALSTAVADGSIEKAAVPFQLLSQITASVAGAPAVVKYAGSAPGLVAGAAQINIQIPPGTPASANASVIVYVGAASTPVGVSVAIQ